MGSTLGRARPCVKRCYARPALLLNIQLLWLEAVRGRSRGQGDEPWGGRDRQTMDLGLQFELLQKVGGRCGIRWSSEPLRGRGCHS